MFVSYHKVFECDAFDNAVNFYLNEVECLSLYVMFML